MPTPLPAKLSEAEGAAPGMGAAWALLLDGGFEAAAAPSERALARRHALSGLHHAVTQTCRQSRACCDLQMQLQARNSERPQ